LTKHDVLGNTAAVIKFTNRRSFQQNLDSLFEGTSHQRSRIGTIDAVTGNRHQHATRSHDIY
jgi:hypothetical protein